MPELRFDGFEGEWEESIFGNEVVRKSSNSDDKNLVRVEYEDIVPDLGILNKNLHSKNSIKRGILFGENDILYGKLRPYLKNYLNPYFQGIAVGDFWVLNLLEGDSNFLFYHIQTNRFQNIANTSIGTKMPRADWNLVSDSIFSFPIKAEQEKIGDLFSKIDQLIESQQELVDQTIAFKKSMLQKMFPTKNNPIPKFRFREFTDNYKNIPLLNVGENLKGTNYSKKDLINEDESVEFIPYDMIFTDYKPIISESSYKVKEKNNSVKSRIGDLIFPASSTTSDNEIVSASAVSKEGIIYGGDINIIRINDLDLAIYLSYYITSTELKNRIFRNVQGTTIHHLYFSSLKNINIWLPTTEEQRAVNRIFLNLDKKIKESEKLLDAYKDMKKSLLQKMFV